MTAAIHTPAQQQYLFVSEKFYQQFVKLGKISHSK